MGDTSIMLDSVEKAGPIMIKLCVVCDRPFKEGDTVVALCVSQYHQLPSRVAYAISPPIECIDIVHMECHEVEDANAQSH